MKTNQYRQSQAYESFLFKQSSSSTDTSSFTDRILSQSKFITFRSKFKYFIDIDDNFVLDRNSKKSTSTTCNISDFIFKNQQIFETSAEEVIYENFINLDIMFTNFNIQIAIDVAINIEIKRVLTQMQKMFNNIIEQRDQQKLSISSKSSDESRLNEADAAGSMFR